jgi:hypothetical protein
MKEKDDGGNGSGFVDVPVPAALYRGIEGRLEETGFDSVASYVAFVLREVLAQDEGAAGGEAARSDDEKIKERLRSLGYLD